MRTPSIHAQTARRRIAPLALLLTIPLAAAACRNGAAHTSDPAARAQGIPVHAARVTDTTLARPISAAGTLAPKDEITLSFKIGGVIAGVRVDAGDEVRAGQTLATLDLREIDAGLSKAQSGAEKAERDLARAQRLYRDSVVTLTQMQDAETAARVARADLAAAEFNRRYAVIVAPASGTVLRRIADEQRTGMHYRQPDPAQLWSIVDSYRLWERRPSDADFAVALHKRVVFATQPTLAPEVNNLHNTDENHKRPAQRVAIIGGQLRHVPRAHNSMEVHPIYAHDKR